MKQITYLSLIVILLASCQSKTNNTEEESSIVKVKLKTENVQILNNNLELKYSGSIEAWKTIPISFQTSGTVQQIFVEEGQKVKKNQLLASLDKSDASSSYAIALAKQKQAEDAYNRLKSVHEQGSLPEIKWVEVLTNLTQARSMAQISKSNLDKCNLLSPVNGFVGKRYLEQGMSAIQVKSPFEIVEINKVFIKISVPENEIAYIKKGQKANIKVSALNANDFTGYVDNIGIVANKFSRTYNVKILVNNSNLDIKPGMVCDVNLNVGKEKAKLVVSAKSLDVDEKGNVFVYVLMNNKKDVVKKTVSIGKYYNNYVEILSGLTEGDLIIKEGKEKLVQGFNSNNSEIL